MAEVMRIIWGLGEATVDDARDAQARSRRPAYRPRYPESELVARSMRERLAGASADARMPALTTLAGLTTPPPVGICRPGTAPEFYHPTAASASSWLR